MSCMLEKSFKILVIIGCLLSLISCKKRGEVTYDINPITINNLSASFASGVFEIVNNSKKDYTFGARYSIEKQINNEWKEIELEDELCWILILYTIPANTTQEVTINWSDTYGYLTDGTYRLVKAFNSEKNSDGLTVYSEFTIVDTREELPLVYLKDNVVEIEQNDPLKKSIDLIYSDIEELNGERYLYQSSLEVFVNYIKESLDIEINPNWRVMSFFNSTDKTYGYVEFQYTVGVVNTNRTIMFELDNNHAYTMYYSNLYTQFDEEQVILTVKNFNNLFKQQQITLKPGEYIYKETTNYTYYIESDTLVYSYNVFYKYGEEKFINNDYGATQIIEFRYGPIYN